MPQSFRRKMVSFLPKLLDSERAAFFSLACSVGRPVKSPELIVTPYSVKASPGGAADIGEAPDVSPASRGPAPKTLATCGATPVRIGRLYFLQNSKSRSSWAGTAIMAPVPYSSRTKFPPQMGTFFPLNGLHAG